MPPSRVSEISTSLSSMSPGSEGQVQQSFLSGKQAVSPAVHPVSWRYLVHSPRPRCASHPVLARNSLDLAVSPSRVVGVAREWRLDHAWRVRLQVGVLANHLAEAERTACFSCRFCRRGLASARPRLGAGAPSSPRPSRHDLT